MHIVKDTGPFHVRPVLWRTDAHQTKKEPLLPAYPFDGSITMAEDRLSLLDMTLQVLNPDVLEPERDYLTADLHITTPSQHVHVIELGHFLVTGAVANMVGGVRQGTISGWDRTKELTEASIPYGMSFSGKDPGAGVRELLIDYGFPASDLDIPDAGFVYDRELDFEGGELWIDMINTILEAGNMYPVWRGVTDGKLRSRSRENVCIRRPVAHYGGESGAFIVADSIDERPDYSMLRNRVTYYRELPDDQAPIYQTARINDPSHPLHPDRLAEDRGVTYPVWKDDPVNDSTLPDPPVGTILALAKAMHRLSERSSYAVSLELETFLDGHLEPHSTVSLDVPFGGRRYYRGNWLQRGWTIGLAGPAATVRRRLYRTEDFE